MKIKKIAISPEKEYESLRQEILKLQEFSHVMLSIQLTVVAAFLGFGLNNNNSLLILVIPPFVFLFAIIRKGYSYQSARIGYYLKTKFEHDDTQLNWHTSFMQHTNNRTKFSKILLSSGITGLFLITPTIALLLGLVKSRGSLLEDTLLFTDGVLIILIFLVQIFYSQRTIRRNIELNNSQFI